MGKKNKSKAPKGRAAAKQKAKKNSPGGGASYSSPMTRISKQAWFDDDDDDLAPSFRGFAQTNTSTPRKDFNSRTPTVNLRHQSIAFVSGGTNTPKEFQPKPEAAEAADESEEEEDEDEDDEGLEDSKIETNILMYTDEEISEGAMANMNINSSAEATGPETGNTNPGDVDIVMDSSTAKQEESAATDPPLFFVDTEGDASLAAGWKSRGKLPRRRSPSPTPSDSSEEVVLFHGRQQPAKTNRPAPSVASSNQRSIPVQSSTPQSKFNVNAHSPVPPSSKATPSNRIPEPGHPQTPHVTDDLLRALERPSSSPSPQPSNPASTKAMGWATQMSKQDQEVNMNATWAPAPAGSWWKKPKKRPDLDPSPEELSAAEGTPRSAPKVALAEPKAEDTIASLQAEWKAVQREKQQAKQSREADEIKLDSRAPKPKRRGKRGRKKDNRSMRQSFDEDEDEDEDGESAYDDYMANLAAQLDGEGGESNGSTTKPTVFGESSLFVDGEEIADDQVLKSHYKVMGDDDDDSDSSSGYSGLIGQDLSELSSSGLEDELEYTEREQWEDEEDLRQRRRDNMTDEQIARMFAKQQEFGYHGDELMIEDGDFEDEVDGVGDVESARAGLADMTNFGPARSKHGMRTRSGLGGRQDTFPDASMLADTVEQYGENGFDIMDLDRPSLRPTKKGRKGRLPPEVEALSDDELRETLRDTWSNDRYKKSEKKAEREEQRMQGLLSGTGKKGKADLSVKYAYGISMEQVHSELRVFLLDDGQQSRPFPPMDKQDRKTLHEVADKLKLKSRSVGAGKNRYLTVYKTARTANVPDVIDRMLAMSSQGAFSRDTRLLGKKSVKKAAKLAGKGPGRGGGGAPATVRNGEIVGANAAELGEGSMGHKLMEKMGWSKGMALGKEGEGRLLPVEQVVRIGTAGLGGSGGPSR
ncbi:squalene synthetase-like protein [Saxophila tyrrhenica]|uniref:Protein SQS1 n=1 Tax=Saxophila tyrrhenica TaxID=1690608 RepID=A0AAV9PJD6_9PEZI|nr:squalene synthetase-like protein [Saxophila tyrrhenica]